MEKIMISNQKQKGMTFIGLVIMFLFIGMLLLAVLRVFPLYYENMSVTTVLEGFVEEFSSDKTMPIAKMKTHLQKRLDVQEVNNLKAKDIVIKRTRTGYSLDASYKPVVNYVGNMNFMIDFNHVIELEK